MKKLMIAAAAAAMIGGAYADVEFVYDFTASVKSTGGKQGKATKVNYTVNCGRDSKEADATWWWGAAGYADDAEAKKAVKKMDNDEKADLAVLLGFDRETKETDYNVKNQEGKWCYTFKFYEEIPAECYRVSKSYKIKNQVAVNSCCEDTWASEDGTCELYIDLLNFFGSQDPEKATKVEMYGEVLGEDDVAGLYAAQVAGQGTVSAKLYKFDGETYGGLKSVSGNIVGFKEAPSCVTCCDNDDPARVFTCDSMDELVDELTAIYGTYTLKFNKNASNKVND